MAVLNRVIKEGDRFAVKYNGVKYVGEAQIVVSGEGDKATEEIMIKAVEPADFVGLTADDMQNGNTLEKRMVGGDDRKTFASLNALMVTIQYPRNFGSQWNFWTRENEFDFDAAPDLAVPAPRGRKAADKPETEPASEDAPKAKRGRKPKAEAEPVADAEQEQPKAKRGRKAKEADVPTENSEEAPKPKRKAGSRARKPKVRSLFDVMEDGTWHCQACMSGDGAFFTWDGEGMPTECPNGHTEAQFAETLPPEEEPIRYVEDDPEETGEAVDEIEFDDSDIPSVDEDGEEVDEDAELIALLDSAGL